MTCSESSILFPTLEIAQDIFSKYLTGCMGQRMPFKLYCERKEEKKPAVQKKSIRGPYRKYTPDEKRDIIQRILQGATLKSIAQQTQIPKRNLIRWKHQFLQNKASFCNIGLPSEESDCCDSKSLRLRKQEIQTKSSFSQSSIKTEKIEV